MKPFLKAFTAIILLTIGLVSLPHYRASAQISREVTIAAADDTLVSADTAYVTLTFDGSFKSVEAWIHEITGTIGGKIVFQGKLPHGAVWQGLDSLALTDADSTDQYKLFTVPNPRLHVAYRLYYLKSGTGSAPIKAYYVRYTGGFIRTPNLDLNWSWNKPKENYNKFIYSDPKVFNINKNKFFIRRSAV